MKAWEQRAKAIVKEFEGYPVRYQAEKLYDWSLSSPDFKECVRLIKKVRGGK